MLGTGTGFEQEIFVKCKDQRSISPDHHWNEKRRQTDSFSDRLLSQGL